MNNIVGLFLIYLIFTAIALFWYQLSAFSSEESMLMAAMSVMAGVFTAGLAGNIQYVYYGAGFTGIVGILLFVFNYGFRRKRKEKIFERLIHFFNPSLMVVTVLFLLSTLLFRRALYTYPDELFQWGSSLKYMFQTHLLPYGDTFTGEDITMSFCTMFQYFFVGVFSYVESNGFVGNFLLMIIPIMLPMRYKTWKQWKDVVLYIGLVLLSMNLLAYVKYYTLLQDYVLPMWTGGIVSWIIWRHKEKNNWLLLLPALITIGAMKSLVGPLFSIIILGLTIIQDFFSADFDKKGKRSFICRIINKKNIVYIPAVIAPFFINMIWSKIIFTNVLNRVVGSVDKNVETIIGSVIVKSFFILENTQKTIPFMSFVIFMVVCIFFTFMLRKVIKEKELKQMFTIGFILYIIGFFGYLAVMIYAYVYVFGVGDSSVVAGLERYLAYYMLIGIVPVITPLSLKDFRFYQGKWMTIVPMCLLMISIFGTGGSFVEKVSSLNRENEKEWMKRIEIKDRVDAFHQLAGSEGKVLIIGRMQGNDAKNYTYEIGNRYIWNQDSYMLDSRDGTYTSCLNVARYPELILKKGYQYIWFQNSTERNHEFNRLCHEYGLLSIENGDLYKIVTENDESWGEYLGNTHEKENEE